MRRTRFVLLALAVMMAAWLLSTAPASAQAPAAVIDARDDSPGSRWAPNAVTIEAGETVRWEFDDALVGHNLHSQGDNWDLHDDSIAPDDPPIEHTFNAPGSYSFICTIHAGMTGTVTVEEADPLDNVLVFSKTGGFRHDSIPAGIQAIQQLGAANDFTVTATEDASVFTDANLAQYDVVTFLSTTGEVLDAGQQAAFERYIQGGGGFAGIHAASDTEYSWPW
jgi:plastocyanin